MIAGSGLSETGRSLAAMETAERQLDGGRIQVGCEPSAARCGCTVAVGVGSQRIEAEMPTVAAELFWIVGLRRSPVGRRVSEHVRTIRDLL